jgi:hypothetical protein
MHVYYLPPTIDKVMGESTASYAPSLQKKRDLALRANDPKQGS